MLSRELRQSLPHLLVGDDDDDDDNDNRESDDGEHDDDDELADRMLEMNMAKDDE